MKEIVAITMNPLLLPTLVKDGRLAASLELCIVVSEPQYRVDQSGAVVKLRETDTIRVTASVPGCRAIAHDLLQWADEADDLASGWTRPTPTTKEPK